MDRTPDPVPDPTPDPPAAGTAAAVPVLPPPRAFTQGVGTVFQAAGVVLFVAFLFVCCGSGLLSKNVAERQDWAAVGWGRYVDRSGPAGPVTRVRYPASRAAAVAVAVGVFLGLAAAGFGLGLQAQRRSAPAGAAVVAAFGSLFWLAHSALFVQYLHSAVLGVLTFVLAVVYGGLCALAVGAWREMRRDPPPADADVLPADYKVPYSHYHPDPPEVRLAAEMERRRQRLLVEQKELEALEERIRRSAGGGKGP
jgi:hypothetical protein